MSGIDKDIQLKYESALRQIQVFYDELNATKMELQNERMRYEAL